jgi:hypothetical protein
MKQGRAAERSGMESRVYAAFGYATKLVEQWPHKRKRGTPCHFSHNWLRLCRAVLYRRIVFCSASKTAPAWISTGLCRLKIGDTAGYTNLRYSSGKTEMRPHTATNYFPVRFTQKIRYVHATIKL